MATNLPAGTLYDFITRDFEAAWEAMVQAVRPRCWLPFVGRFWSASLPGGGNFLFARQAMTLLELAARMCRVDASGGTAAGHRTPSLVRLSHELAQRDRRYFTELPATIPARTSAREFTLPSLGPNPGRELLFMLFDLIRNGQAHQYQQINVDMAGGTELQISLTGVGPNLSLNALTTRPADHLAFATFGPSIVALVVRPDVLYLDVKAAIERAGLPTSGLQIEHLERDPYPFSAADLMAALRVAGHHEIRLPGAPTGTP